MTNYNWDMESEVGGYLGQENKPVMTNNAHEDDFALKEENDGPRTGETFQETSKRSTDNGDTDIGVGGKQLLLLLNVFMLLCGIILVDIGLGVEQPDTLFTPGVLLQVLHCCGSLALRPYVSTFTTEIGLHSNLGGDICIIGPKSGYGASSEDAGAYDRPSYVQSRFGLDGKTGSNRTEGSNLLLKETGSRSNAGIDPRASASDQMTAPGEDGWRPEDLSMSLHSH